MTTPPLPGRWLHSEDVGFAGADANQEVIVHPHGDTATLLRVLLGGR